MRHYLRTLHRQPDHHKKRFAFLASSTVTLFIFGIWAIANFGVNDKVITEKSSQNEVGPFQSLQASVTTSIKSIGESFSELETGLNSKNLESKYKELRNNALDTYGR